MRTLFIISTTFALSVACQSQKSAPSETETSVSSASTQPTKENLKTDIDKLNYTVGVEIGKHIKRNNLKLDDDIFLKGLHDGLDEIPPLLDDQEMIDIKQADAEKQRDLRKKEYEDTAEKNKKEGESFLKTNGAKPGVVTTKSGLQYKIISEGKGKKPKETDKVSVHYKGTLLDGTEFDSSYQRNAPAELEVNRVVKGWTEALQLMPVGSTWQLFLPSDLAYGERGAGAKIGPNSVLIFEIHLLNILSSRTTPGAVTKAPSTVKQSPKPAIVKPASKPAAKTK